MKKASVETNGSENRENWFFIKNTLKRQKTQTKNIRNEIGDVITNPIDIK
jgi:hypothetical protein